MVTKIKIKKKIKELRESAKGCLEQRACLGRGYRGYTDELLQKANSFEAQANSLQQILEEEDGD